MVFVDKLVRCIEGGEADNNDMHVGLATRFAHPGECAMREMNFQAILLKERIPQSASLFALAD